MKRVQFLTGFFCGALLFCGLVSGSAAVADLTAYPTKQTFYLDGQKVEFEAYAIHGNNFVKLRDIGKAVDFGVTYDAGTNSVYIDPDQPYVEEGGQTTPAPAELTEEAVYSAIRALRDIYPTNTPYGAPYVPNDPLHRPFSNCDHCAGWAMKCSDAAFGDLPWRAIENPRWEDIRVGDVLDYRNSTSGHAIVVLRKTDEYVSVTESGMNNKVRWGGQYPRWWLEEQPGLTLNTRYPD